jgi:hypothetical protein
MARPKKVVDSEESKSQEGNIPGLEALAVELQKGKMPEKKLIALRVKLVSLYKEGKITEEEQELMEAILRKERNLARILPSDQYLLNTIESERCEDTCIVKTDDVPQVHHLKKDLECKFYYDPEYNDGKGKKDSIGRYYVYVPRTVPTEHQLSIATVRKELKGHPTDASEYPEPKILLKRLSLKQTEFERWFDVPDAEILKPVQAEPEYKF